MLDFVKYPVNAAWEEGGGGGAGIRDDITIVSGFR